jgi:hypothetical protein
VNVDLLKDLAHIGYGERYRSINRYLARLEGCVTEQLAAGFPFVVRNSFQALSHLTRVRASVVGFNLSPILKLCLFDGSSEGIAGFLISVRISVPLLESGNSNL